MRMQQAASKVRDPDVQVTAAGEGARVIHLSGAWDIRALESRVGALQSALRDAARLPEARWDLSQIQRFDHTGALLVWRTWGRCRPGRLQLRREHEIFFGACETAEAVASSPAAAERFALLLARGRGVWAVTGHVLEILQLFGQLLRDAASVARLPLLVLWTSGVALVAGAVSANAELGMSAYQFFTALPAAVPEVNLWLGVGKGAVFGVLIALIACHFGLRIQPNTESLAAGTTRSVVTSITAVIVADAVLAVVFSDVGWG